MSKIETTQLSSKIEEEIKQRMEKRRERLRQVMQEKLLTLEDLGKQTGVAKSSIQRYLTGETEKIPIDFFEKVSKVTGVPVEYLTCFEENENAPIEGYQSEFNEIFRKLDEERREELINYGKYLSNK